MKKNILGFLFTTLCFSVLAQTPVTDSVSLGGPVTAQVQPPLVTDSVSLGAPAGGFSYPNDVYYNIRNGASTSVPGTNWHIAFAARKAGGPTDVLRAATILANEGRGVSIYESTQPVTGWALFDTTGYTTWLNPHNSDSLWTIGAFNASASSANPFDFGWGMYNMSTHNIEGMKIYLVRVAVGSSITFKKLTIASLTADSAWTFTYANLDNTDSTTVTIAKNNYNNKLFAYHNLLNDTTYNREPNGRWDVLFTRYGAYATQFGQTIFSANTGVLSHPNILTSKVVNTPTAVSVPGTYSLDMTGIGTDWKENPGPGQPNFIVKDSISYFTKDSAGNQTKLVFAAFRGSSTGVIAFKRGNALPQTVTLETYPNDVYYDMGTGTVATVQGGSNWHLAFATRKAAPPFNVMRSTTILANEGRGVSVFESSQPVSNFASFDTTGYTTWPTPHNSDSTWDIGALNANRTSSATDFGWGEYDMVTHDLMGTKIFLVRITKGNGPNMTVTFKKVLIEKLAFDTVWTFKYANLDNTGLKTVSFSKAGYTGKLFAYHNLLTDSTSDREPAGKWDLLFTRYGAFSTQFGQTIFSANTGVLSYPTLLTSKVTGVLTDSATAGTYAHFLTGIGTDWKINPGPGQPSFVIRDSVSYFTKDETNHESKLVFTSFAGSSTGTIVFAKTELGGGSTGITPVQESGLVSIYPNPASNMLNIGLNKLDNGSVAIADIAGRTQLTAKLSELTSAIDISTLQSGIYFVRIENNNSISVVRLVVQ